MRRLTMGCLIAGLMLAAWAPILAQDEGEGSAEGAPVKKIKMYAENWRWVPNVIRVAEGTRLIIDFVSRDASHSFVLKAYKLKVPLPERSEGQVEFVANRKGEFRWRCGRPCGDGCAKMTGKLIVE